MKAKIKIIRVAFSIFTVMLVCGCVLSNSDSDNRIRVEIISYVVRDRIITLNHIEMRSTIIIGFKILPWRGDLRNFTVSGELFHDGKLLSKDEITHVDSGGNSFGFDIALSNEDFGYEKQYSIPEGNYQVIIKLFDQNRNSIAQSQKEFKRNQIGRTFYGFDEVYEQPQYILINDEKTVGGSLRSSHQKDDRFARGSLRLMLEAKEQQTVEGALRLRPEATDQTHYKSKQKAKDYIVFQKSYLERVYTDTEPKPEELITELSTEISRNEYKPITFSIRSSKDLGKVKISIATFKDKQGKASGVAVDIGALNQLTEVVRQDDKKNVIYYQYAPRIIEDKEVAIPQHHTQTCWLTIKTNSETKPGDYYGSIKIMHQSGKQTEIPVRVKVLPLTLTDTDKQYGMMMDYAFYELDNKTWTEKENKLIQKQGEEIYKDLRDHGMTMIYPHSYFYYKANKNGEPILNSLRASLESYKNLQFPGPFVWYLGHLLQTAKTKHPGSILNYDAEVAKGRLQDLLIRFEKMAEEVGIPKDKLIVQLIDEPDSDQKERTQAGKELHKVAKELGFKILITRPWTDVDVICTGTPDNQKQADQLRNMAKAWWIYPNNALESKNLAYTRYVFGFGVWRWGVDGVAPWTYQMSQGSNGNPFTVLDGPEIMVAYPGVNGTIPTPTWEAIRDGINDYKYIYLLKNLIYVEKRRGNPVATSIDEQLKQFKQNLGKEPGPEEAEFGDWSPGAFTKYRKQIIEWAMELSKQR